MKCDQKAMLKHCCGNLSLKSKKSYSLVSNLRFFSFFELLYIYCPRIYKMSNQLMSKISSRTICIHAEQLCWVAFLDQNLVVAHAWFL